MWILRFGFAERSMTEGAALGLVAAALVLVVIAALPFIASRGRVAIPYDILGIYCAGVLAARMAALPEGPAPNPTP
jgi:hypothetical protein